MSVRDFPKPKHDRRGQGICQWCGLDIMHDEGPKAGQVNTRRTWHPVCLTDYFLHTRRDVQFSHVAKRDGLRCWDCSSEPEKWLKQSWPTTRSRYGPTGSFDQQDRRIEYVGIYFAIERVTALELEHQHPLWLTVHMTDEERRPYFGPGNLRLRCPTCHKAKSKVEAAQRAHGNRLIEKAKPDRERKGPKMQSRPFGGQARSMSHPTLKRGMDGKVRPR